MITLVCSKCSTTFQVDDGFAGGVCRCSTCGTIQTVPTKEAAERGTVMPGGAISGHSLYERKDVNVAPRKEARKGGDLQALSDIVTSSGLAGSGMLGQSRSRYRSAPPEQKKSMAMGIAIGAGATLLVLLTLLGVYLFTGQADDTTNGTTATVTPDATPPVPIAETPIVNQPGKPAFATISLENARTVVFLIDRGEATREYIVPLRRAIQHSVLSLGDKRKFQVRYWSSGDDSPVFPPEPADASTTNATRLGQWMTGINTGRATDALDSVAAALAAKPTELIILTGRAWQLDDAFATDALQKIRAAGGTRVHAVSLGGTDTNDSLSRLALRTGGQAITLSADDLSAIGK